MKIVKKMGIWMDHSKAFLMELSDNIISESIIVSEFDHQEKELGLIKAGKKMDNREQQQRSVFYKKLGDIIRQHQEVVLFGPTDAKKELLNLIKTDHLFDHVKIEIKNSDKMTANKMHGFVKDYFNPD